MRLLLKGKFDKPVNCIMVFALMFMPLLFISLLLQAYNDVAFQLVLFFTGWFGWTFLEYMSHRYLMHSKKKENKAIDFNHQYHHTHPWEIKILGRQRLLLCTALVVILAICIRMDNYITFLGGFFCGLPGYTLMHFFLHQKITQKIFKKRVRYHIYHHCKYPDKCFGISLPWWDELFGTIPENPGVFSQRIIDFYFKDEMEKGHGLQTKKATVFL